MNPSNKLFVLIGIILTISYIGVEGNALRNRRFRRQISSSSASASSSSSSGSTGNNNGFGIGAAAGIGGRIGAGCSGLSCGFQLGDYIAQFPFFRNSQGNTLFGTRIAKLDSNPTIIQKENDTAAAEIIERKVATPPSATVSEDSSQIPSPTATERSDSAIPRMTAQVQRNTANLMRTAQDFINNLLGGLRDFSSNLAGLFQGNNSTGTRNVVSFQFPTLLPPTAPVRTYTPTAPAEATSTSSNEIDNDNNNKKRISDSDAYKNLIVL